MGFGVGQAVGGRNGAVYYCNIATYLRIYYCNVLACVLVQVTCSFTTATYFGARGADVAWGRRWEDAMALHVDYCNVLYLRIYYCNFRCLLYYCNLGQAVGGRNGAARLLLQLTLINLIATATYVAYFTTATWCRQWEDAMALHVVKLKGTHEIYVYGWECSWIVTALVWYGCIAGVHCSLRPHTLVA